ncbi:MAG TPA: type II CAAX endopeptidase family protein [Acidobacteriaceae bacterium]
MPDDLSLNSSGELSMPQPPVEHGPRWVFFGKDGLRAGWSALLFVVIYLALALGCGAAIKLMHVPVPSGKGPVSPKWALAFELVQVCLVMIATGIMARIERRKLAVYGYAGRARLPRFLFGCAWGFVALSALVAVLWRSHLLTFDSGHLHGFAAWKYGLVWLVMFIFTGIYEESLLRGYLQYTLTRGIGFWWGALLMSVLFGALHGHNVGESPIGLFSAAAVGLVFCISLWYTGSLWWAIGFHAAWDWAQTFFYGTPDSGMVARGHFLSEHPTGPLLWSGGPTGPEGSIYIVPLLIIMVLAMWLWWRRKPVAGPYDTNA